MNTSTASATLPESDLGLLSSEYVEQVYALYQENPSQVSAEWQAFFCSQQTKTSKHQPVQAVAVRPIKSSVPTVTLPAAPPPTASPEASLLPATSGGNGAAAAPTVSQREKTDVPASHGGNGQAGKPDVRPEEAAAPPAVNGNHNRELHHQGRLQESVDLLIRNYRVRGHLIAKVDPLGIPRPMPAELEPEFWGLSESDLDRQFSTYSLAGSNTQTLRDIMERLRNTYCGSICAQFMHIDDLEVREWLQRRMEESQNRLKLSRDEQIRILTRLTDAVIFEEFIRRKFVGAKSFSLEGAESLIPLLDLAIEKAAAQGIESIVMAMAHRGRLNVLANIIGKCPQDIFREFEDIDPELYRGGGDVKYHLGYYNDYVTSTGRRFTFRCASIPATWSSSTRWPWGSRGPSRIAAPT